MWKKRKMFKSLPVVHVLQHGCLLLGMVVLRDDHQVPLHTTEL